MKKQHYIVWWLFFVFRQREQGYFLPDNIEIKVKVCLYISTFESRVGGESFTLIEYENQKFTRVRQDKVGKNIRYDFLWDEF